MVSARLPSSVMPPPPPSIYLLPSPSSKASQQHLCLRAGGGNTSYMSVLRLACGGLLKWPSWTHDHRRSPTSKDTRKKISHRSQLSVAVASRWHGHPQDSTNIDTPTSIASNDKHCSKKMAVESCHYAVLRDVVALATWKLSTTGSSKSWVCPSALSTDICTSTAVFSYIVAEQTSHLHSPVAFISRSLGCIKLQKLSR